jgi:hypothetical protein
MLTATKGRDVDYNADLLERGLDDENGQALCDLVAAHLTYLSNKGLDNFMLIPVQNNGRTVSVIVTSRGENPEVAAGRRAFQELTGLDNPSQLPDNQDSN